MLDVMNRFVSLCIVSMFAVFAVSGCTSKPDTPVSSLEPGTTMAATAATSSGEVIPLDLSFTDPELLDSITIAGFVPVFDISSSSKEKLTADLDGGTVSLVHIQATTGGEYYSDIQDTRFRMICDEKVSALQTSAVATDMTAAGFVPFPDDGIKAGESGDYWVAFLAAGNPNPTDCTLTYTRDAAKQAGTGDDIPVYTTTVQLN